MPCFLRSPLRSYPSTLSSSTDGDEGDGGARLDEGAYLLPRAPGRLILVLEEVCNLRSRSGEIPWRFQVWGPLHRVYRLMLSPLFDAHFFGHLKFAFELDCCDSEALN